MDRIRQNLHHKIVCAHSHLEVDVISTVNYNVDVCNIIFFSFTEYCSAVMNSITLL